jgi:hypothetical protein
MLPVSGAEKEYSADPNQGKPDRAACHSSSSHDRQSKQEQTNHRKLTRPYLVWFGTVRLGSDFKKGFRVIPRESTGFFACKN